MTKTINKANQTSKLKLYKVFYGTSTKAANETYAFCEIDPAGFDFTPYASGTVSFLGNSYNLSSNIVAGDPPVFEMTTYYSGQSNYIAVLLKFPPTSSYYAQSFSVDFVINVYQEISE